MGRLISTIWRYIKQTDIVLILSALVASGYGFILIYSARGTGRASLIQGIGIAVGFAIMITLSKVDYHDVEKYWKYIAIVCILLLALTLLFGKSRANSQDKAWIWLGPITIQPAEYVKVAFAFTFSKHCDSIKDNINAPINIMLLFLHALIPILFLVLQRDMGMALVFILMFVVMLYMANVKLRFFAIAGILSVIGFPLIWDHILKGTQKYRILSLFNPTKYAKYAYQQTQGVKAIGSGEIYGYGLFNGPLTQGADFLLPEKQNDMIFAVAGEELGFVGCAMILLVISVFLTRPCLKNKSCTKRQ